MEAELCTGQDHVTIHHRSTVVQTATVISMSRKAVMKATVQVNDCNFYSISLIQYRDLFIFFAQTNDHCFICYQLMAIIQTGGSGPHVVPCVEAERVRGHARALIHPLSMVV